MSKLHLWSIIFLVIEIIALVPLGIEIFGHMNTDVIIISAVVFGIGMFGNIICTLARVAREYEQKKK